MLDKIHTMKSAEGIEDILGIDSILVSKTIVNDDFVLIRTKPKYDVAICPKCKKPTNIVHQRKRRLIRDVQWAGKDTFLEIESRRFRCSECQSGEYVFTEPLDFVDSNQRQTIRYQKYMARLCKNNTVEFAADFECIGNPGYSR